MTWFRPGKPSGATDWIASAVLSLAAACALPGVGTAQQEPSKGQREALGRIIGVGVVLSSGDFLGGGSFDIEDDQGTVKVRHLLLHHRFGERDQPYEPWIVAGVGRVVIRQPIELLGETPDWSRFEADALGVEGGVEIDLGGAPTTGAYVEPRFGLIYSWVESVLRYNSPESEALRPVLDGVLFNWEAEALSVTTGARFGYRAQWSSQAALDVAGLAVGLWTNPVETDSPVQDTTTRSRYGKLQARARLPLGVSVAENRLFVVPRVARTWFSEEIEEPLESDTMTELNLRLLAELIPPPDDAGRLRRLVPKALGLSVSYTRADTFEGWSFGITFHPWAAGW